MKDFLKEFKAFITRGNVLDLAIAVVIGAAFNQITTSLVTNIITPPIGLLIGGFDFSKLSAHLGGEAVIGYGLFIQAVINFLIVAFALFILIKAVSGVTRRQKKEEKKEEDATLVVLKEIRDALKADKS